MPWLLKTEPDCYSIDDLKRDRRTWWDGVRNYQARNFMRDQMRVGDEVLFYHSSAEPPGVAGVARVSKSAKPDPTALDPKDDHFDPKATTEQPIWTTIEIEFVRRFDELLSLERLRGRADLAGLPLLARGQRLSVQPVSPEHFAIILSLAEGVSRRGKAKTDAKR